MFSTIKKNKRAIGAWVGVALLANAGFDAFKYANDTALPTTMTLEETQNQKTALMNQYRQLRLDVDSGRYLTSDSHKRLIDKYCAHLKQYDLPYVPKMREPGGIEFNALSSCMTHALVDEGKELATNIHTLDRMQKGLVYGMQ